jgi:outer membrane protein OmpA-like peptidoglycan-associated protein
MAQKTKTALLKELNTYFAQLQKVDKAALNHLPSNLKVTVANAASTIKSTQEASNEDSNHHLEALIKIAKELTKIIPPVELLLNRFSKGSVGFLAEEIKLIKRCYYLIQGGGHAKSYHGYVNDTRCLLNSPELASFKKAYPGIKNEIDRVYPLPIIPANELIKLGNPESILKEKIESLKKMLGTTKEAIELAKQDRNNETSSSHENLFQKFISCSEQIDGILDRDPSLKSYLKEFDDQLVKNLIKDINEILDEHTILHKHPVDDNSSNVEDVTEYLDAYKATVDINVLGGIELPKGIRSFNYKGGLKSSLKLPRNASGEIELIVEYALTETHFSGTRYQTGKVKLYMNYSTSSYGKIELIAGRSGDQNPKKNNSWSKITYIGAHTNSNNDIEIVITLEKHGTNSSNGIALAVKPNEAVTVTGSYGTSWTEAKGLQRMKVFTLSLKTEEAEKNVFENTTELEFDNDSAIIRSDDINTIINWWQNIGQGNRDKILAQDAVIEITGYASPEGTEYYNIKLADKRAKEVQSMLNKVIGERSEGDGLAKSHTRALGECTEDPRRYVKIEIK